MAHDIEVAVISHQFEVAVIRRQPAVDDVDHLDAAIVDDQRARRFLTAMAGVTFDPYRHLMMVG